MAVWRDPRQRLRYGLIALLILAVAALATFYIERQAGELGARFTERAEFFALVIADRAALYLSQHKHDELRLLAQTVALGNVVYVQVFTEGQLIVDERGPLAAGLELPPVEGLEPYAERRSSANLRYLEIIKPLPRLGSAMAQGYVRLGTSLEPLAQEIRGKLLLIVALSLASVVAGIALIIYLTRPAARAWQQERKLEGARPESHPGVSSLTLDDAAKRVLLRGEEVELSPREFELLKLLSSEPGRVFSNREILEAVWKGQGFATAKDVKQYVYLLRRKLEEDPRHPQLILTVRGFGYKLNEI
ncbi:MAG: winged helix-turn-helix domain-containing protein [Candidatus Bipolaricaulia bacterium]